MTNAELEVIEVFFNRPLHLSGVPTPGISSWITPVTPDFRQTVASTFSSSVYSNADDLGMTKDGTRVDHVTSAFATELFQIDNALTRPVGVDGGKHWSHALPGVMKDPELELEVEARAIEASFDE